MNTIDSTNASPSAYEEVLEDGFELLKLKQFEKAIDFFAQALEKAVTKTSEMDLFTAPYYLEYGHALVYKVEVFVVLCFFFCVFSCFFKQLTGEGCYGCLQPYGPNYRCHTR